MSNSETEIKQVRNTLSKGVSCQCFSFLVPIGYSESLLQALPESVKSLVNIVAICVFLYGYGICWKSACQYVKYKGYPGYLGLLSILSLFGLSFLFLLDNKNLDDYTLSNNQPFDNFSILATVIGLFAIIFVSLLAILIPLLLLFDIDKVSSYFEDEDFVSIIAGSIILIFGWYIFKEIHKSNINLKQVIGSLNKINFQLPIVLATLNFFLVWGLNRITLYYLSFLVPNYAENIINQEYPDPVTVFGWITYFIVILILFPILLQVYWVGIIFQKLAIKYNVTKSLLISASIFAIIPFRYSVISFFVFWLISIVLYVKTKLLTISMIYYFFYDLIAEGYLLYIKIFSDRDNTVPITATEYQHQFTDNLGLIILSIALSAPYLSYFIYKNFPRKYKSENLPYFANQTD